MNVFIDLMTNPFAVGIQGLKVSEGFLERLRVRSANVLTSTDPSFSRTLTMAWLDTYTDYYSTLGGFWYPPAPVPGVVLEGHAGQPLPVHDILEQLGPSPTITTLYRAGGTQTLTATLTEQTDPDLWKVEVDLTSAVVGLYAGLVYAGNIPLRQVFVAVAPALS